MRFHWCIFSCHASGTLSANRYSVDSFCLPFWYFSPSPRCRDCVADGAVGVGTSQSITAFDQLWPSVMVSICCKTKLLWWGPRATLTCGSKDEDLDYGWMAVGSLLSLWTLWTWIVDYVSSTRNKFPLIEWSLSSVKTVTSYPQYKNGIVPLGYCCGS